MSFRLFIYYCALCGGWAAFVVWAFVQLAGVHRIGSVYLQAALTRGLLGPFLPAAVGFIDSLLNATGGERFLRTLICAGLGLVSGALGGFVGQMLFVHASIPVFVGWMLAGVLMGASIGAYDVLQAITSGRGSAGS